MYLYFLMILAGSLDSYWELWEKMWKKIFSAKLKTFKKRQIISFRMSFSLHRIIIYGYLERKTNQPGSFSVLKIHHFLKVTKVNTIVISFSASLRAFNLNQLKSFHYNFLWTCLFFLEKIIHFVYRTRAIISHGFYIFYLIFQCGL